MGASGSHSSATTLETTPSIVRKEKSEAAGSLERRTKDLEPAHNIPILPHLPKFAIVVNKGGNQGLGEYCISTYSILLVWGTLGMPGGVSPQ